MIEDDLPTPCSVDGAQPYAARDERGVIKPRIGNV
jgi:hypothetical protein